jgi:IS5 family transposase
MAAGTIDPALSRQVEYESRVESWRWVRCALLEHMGAVVEQTDWRSPGARWTLAESKFAADTVETAQRIRRRLAAPAAAGQLEAELERLEGVARPSRWLRCLRDVGLVSRHGGRWAWERNGELYFHREY